MHPDDRDRYLATITSAWEQVGACSNEYRVIRHDGRVAWLSSHGKTIAGCVRKADTLARHGGDEFVVVIPDIRQDGDCRVVAEKILRALEPPFRVDDREFTIGASIGVSLYPTDAGDGEGALRNADAAMYRAKQLGRNNYRFYGS